MRQSPYGTGRSSAYSHCRGNLQRSRRPLGKLSAIARATRNESFRDKLGISLCEIRACFGFDSSVDMMTSLTHEGSFNK